MPWLDRWPSVSSRAPHRRPPRSSYRLSVVEMRATTGLPCRALMGGLEVGEARHIEDDDV